MIVTKTWLQDYIDIANLDTNNICTTFNAIGLEVDSLEKVRIPSGVVVGFIKEKSKHPDADKLSVCQVDIGEEVVQIVCGAKNVAQGQYVPVATVGTVLGKDFKIKKAKLRGEASAGMICSSSEIGLPKLNDGIMPLDDSIGELVIGKELNEYRLLNDDIIEIELTANRGDCLSIHGVARELCAYYNIPLLEKEKHLNYNDTGIGQVLEVECDSSIDTSLIFRAIDFESFCLPLLYQLRLGIINKYSGNDIKDAIEYSTHCSGVILNAYAKEDTDKHDDLALIHVKKDKDGFDCIYGKEQLSTICIDQGEMNTKDTTMIIEASYMNPELLCKNVFEKKKTTGDIYYRTSRGSEPNIKDGIDTFTTFISTLGAKVYRGSEIFAEDTQKQTIDISTRKINAIIGQSVSKAQVEKILSGLGFEVKDGGDGILSIAIPLFRHDIKNIADVTEEIVRIIGIDNIKSKPLAFDEANRVNTTSTNIIKKNHLRAKAVENGFFETLTYVFTNRNNLEKYNFDVVNEKLDILNPIVNELNTYRSTLLLNLVEAVSHNVKSGFKKIAFFEVGTIYNKKREESQKIAFIFSGDSEEENFLNGGKPQTIEFFSFAKKVLNTIGEFEIEPMEKITNDFIHPYQSGNILIDGKVAGFISKLHPTVANDFDINDTFIAEVDFEMVKNELTKVQSYSKFQASKKDLSIIVPKDMQYSQIKQVIRAIKDDNIKQFNLIDTYSDESLKDNESLTLRFVLQNNDKTLEEEDITSTMDTILSTLKEKLNVTLR
jgi:phenylalanyl-tRNA synthetase beta chain